MRKLVVLFFVCLSWMGTAQETHTLSSESVMTIAGTSTVQDWEVTATSLLGSLTATDAVITDLKIEVPVSEIKSERGPTMDTKMYAALKAEEHPSIYFSGSEFKDTKATIGILAIAGVEKEIQVVVKVVQNNGNIVISGAQELLFKDYGMEPPTAMFGQIVVGDSVTVKFDLTFERN